jgi:hypothetical protein
MAKGQLRSTKEKKKPKKDKLKPAAPTTGFSVPAGKSPVTGKK